MEEATSGGTSVRQPTKVEVFATVTRADGRVQPLGLVSARYSWKSPIKKLTWPVKKRLADRRIRKANAGMG